MTSDFNRRKFLKNVGFSGAAVTLRPIANLLAQERPRQTAENPPMRQQLLAMVNRERAAVGASALKLDELAINVAQLHAIEMAQNNFLSHWGLDGRKPYHRYAFAGGTEATAENDSAVDHSAPMSSEEIASDFLRMHQSMHDEVPPNDGHRLTMLAPQNTHVGFGLAVRGMHVRLCEVYVARYVSVDPYPITRPPQSRFIFSGRVLDLNYTVEGVDVFYEPLPRPPEMRWLQVPRSYGLPENPENLAPKLPPNTFYDDGTAGTIEFPARGHFRVPIELSKKQPGIYTLVVWIQRSEKSEAFPATHVCIRAE